MRDIKFRIWNILYKEMFYPSSTPIMNGEYAEKFYLQLNGKLRGDFKHCGDVDCSDDYVLQQFTGLIDKNNKEIYDGDILERVGNGSFCKIVVGWNDKECCFVHNNVNNLHGSPSPLHDNFVNLCDWTYWVVCGNIFENPELLEQ
jgi:uncharacterized phage protein (TIGR01671 family)